MQNLPHVKNYCKLLNLVYACAVFSLWNPHCSRQTKKIYFCVILSTEINNKPQLKKSVSKV